MNLKRKSLFILSILVLILTLITSVNAETSLLYVNPSTIHVNSGENFTINISCTLNEPIEGYEFDLIFDPTFLKVNSVTEGTIFQNFTTWYNSGTIDNTLGYINNVYSLITSDGNTSESGTIAMISFTALSKKGTTNIILNDTGLSNDRGYISISVQPGQITINDNGNNSDNQDNTETADPPSNTKPTLPEKPQGKQICLVNTSYFYSSRAIDIENDQLYYTFNWGDGKISENLGPFPSGTYCNTSHEWTLPDVYNITVKATDIHGKISDWSPQLTIVVQNPKHEIGYGPNASFTYEPKDPTINQNIQFEDTSLDNNGEIIKWKWDFGDNTTSDQQNPIHQYQKEGIYNITLTVWNTSNSTDIYYFQLSIESADQNNTPINLFAFILIFMILITIKNKFKKYTDK